MNGLSAAIRQHMVELSDELDREGVGGADQVAAFGAMIMMALAAMPPDAGRLVAFAHIQAIMEGLDDPGIAAAGAIIRERGRPQ